VKDSGSPPHLPFTPSPGPSPLELLRSARIAQSNTLQFLTDLNRDYGDFVQIASGPLNLIFLNHPRHVQHILLDNHHNYGKDTFQYRQLSRITGNGLLVSDPPYWLHQRRLIQPAFSRPRIQEWIPLISTSVQSLLDRWEQSSAAQAPLDVDQEMMRLALEIVGKALFSLDLSKDAQELTQSVMIALDHIVMSVRQPFSMPEFVPTPENIRFRRAIERLDQVIEQLIEERLSVDNHTHPPLDLMGMFLSARDPETGQGMNVSAIRDEIITLLIAGHETVASALTWTWFLLSQHPQARDRLAAEARQILDPRRLPEPQDYNHLVYTRAVFAEALRLYPPAWIITRKALEEDRLDDFRIPRGATVIISPYILHRHSEFWEDPHQFIPERFLVGGKTAAHRFAYIPFGGGPRLCIGNNFAEIEATIILAMISQRYTLEVIDPQQVKMDALVTLRPHAGLPMWIKPTS
jgi:cytochrome P450